MGTFAKTVIAFSYAVKEYTLSGGMGKKKMEEKRDGQDNLIHGNLDIDLEVTVKHVGINQPIDKEPDHPMPKGSAATNVYFEDADSCVSIGNPTVVTRLSITSSFPGSNSDINSIVSGFSGISFGSRISGSTSGSNSSTVSIDTEKDAKDRKYFLKMSSLAPPTLSPVGKKK